MMLQRQYKEWRWWESNLEIEKLEKDRIGESEQDIFTDL